ncbi:hypothetical protein ACRAWF_20685 [Streptomyces sp. L7]
MTGYDEGAGRAGGRPVQRRRAAPRASPSSPPGSVNLATAKPSFIRMDDPEHARLRRMVSKDFLVKRIEELRPGIQDIVDRAVDRMTEGRTSADLVADFALPIPLAGHLPDARGAVRGPRAVPVAQPHPPRQPHHPAGGGAGARPAHGLSGGVGHTSAAAPPTTSSGRLAAREDLTAQETASLGFLLLVTGHESTANMTAVSVLALLQRPDQAGPLRADPGLVRGAVRRNCCAISRSSIWAWGARRPRPCGWAG